MLATKRKLPGLVYAENATREVKLSKGFLERKLIIEGAYTATVATDATAVRAYACPVKTVSVIGNSGKVLQSWVAADLVRHVQVYEQAPLASMLTVPGGITAAGGPYTGAFALHVPFASLFALESNATALPTWIYDELILRVEWGSHAELYVGGTGSVVMNSLSVTQDGIQDDLSALGPPEVWARSLPRHIVQYKSAASGAGADAEFTIELPRTADIRSLFIVTLDANGEPVNTILNSATLLIDNTIRLVSDVSRAALRADNALLYGQTLPTGVQVIEFAEDKDIVPPAILEATKMTALDLIINKAAVAGTVRVVIDKVELPGIAE